MHKTHLYIRDVLAALGLVAFVCGALILSGTFAAWLHGG